MTDTICRMQIRQGARSIAWQVVPLFIIIILTGCLLIIQPKEKVHYKFQCIGKALVIRVQIRTNEGENNMKSSMDEMMADHMDV